MRTPYASQYLVPQRISMQEGAGEGPDPQIGQDVTIGTDLRTLFLYRDDTESRNHFVQMQGALYLAFQFDERISAYIHQEFVQDTSGPGESSASAYEVFATAHVLPWSGYIKTGRFVPAFGWRVPDHRTFTRRNLVFLPAFPPHSDTGVEVGFRPGGFFLQGSILNGEFRSTFDSNDEFAYAGRGSWLGSWRALNIAVGGSYYRNRRTTGVVRAWGPFAGANWNRLTWTGEADWSEAGPVATFTTAHELSVEVVQGVDVIGTYDFDDVNRDLKSGAVHRIGFGVEAFPYPYLQLRTKFNAFQIDEGPDVNGRHGYSSDFLQTQVEVHVVY